MKYVVVDLEMNNVAKGSGVRRRCSQETIEIGAVMLDENMQEVSSFRTYVRPEYNACIAPQIELLTGITFDMVENAPAFSEAFHMFTSWCLGTGDEVMIYAWSGTDYAQIAREVLLKDYAPSTEEAHLIKYPWLDFQAEFDQQLGFKKSVSLKNALNMAGLDFSGREHDALDDARSTAQLMKIFRDRELFEATLSRIEDVMKPSSGGVCLGDMFDMSAFYVA